MTTLVLSDDDVCRFKNKKVIDVFLPIVFSTVLRWGCKKQDEESFKDFLCTTKTTISGWNKYSKKNNLHNEGEKLKENDFESELFDVTFLSKLIPEACEDIDKDALASSDDDTKLEYLLREGRDFRNDVCHGRTTGAIDRTLLDKIEELTIKLLDAAGNRYSVDRVEVNKMKDEFICKLSQIRHTDLTEKEKRLIQYDKKFRNTGRKEIKKWKKVTTVFLPFSQSELVISEIFHGINLIITDEDKNGEEIRYCDLLQHLLNSERKVGLIIGEAGAGKSTHLKRMHDDYFDDREPEIFDGVRKFPLVLYFDCRNTTIMNCKDWMERNFPDTLKSVKKVKDGINVLRLMGILILVDGLDEINSTSRSVLNELLDKFGAYGNANFVLTTRPNEEKKWSKILQGYNIDYVRFHLKPLNNKSEQETFLMRYPNTDPELIHAFRSLNVQNSCETYFCYPIYLVLFYYLYKKNPATVKEWKNEVNIMNQFLNFCEESIIERLNTPEMENRNTIELAKDVMTKVCDLSLRLAVRDEVIITENECTRIGRSVFKDLLINHRSILSCIFFSQSDQEGFQFLHKSQCEFMASKAIVEKLTGEPATKISNIYPSNRLQNVYRFVVMTLHERGKQDLLKQVLKEMYAIWTKKNERAEFEYWVELAASCSSSKVVAKEAAKAAKVVTDEDQRWTVTNPRNMAVVVRMMKYHQPRELMVSVFRGDTLQQFHGLIPQHYKGGLGLNVESSYWNFIPADDLIRSLSSSQCYLTLFKGCLDIIDAVAGKELVTALEKNPNMRLRENARRPRPQLFISLTQPRLHLLSRLNNVKLEVRAKLQPDGGPQQRRPLPLLSCRPTLVIVWPAKLEVANVARAAADLIQDLAPSDKKCAKIGT